ncbi:MAG: TrbI F-type domain-containing protein, partial [Acidobacteria bacterium]|nr:TrbI F-type domain-containing protein [Acidobacteriota bacterium]
AMVRLTQPDPPRIASVRLGDLTARFALDVAGDGGPKEVAAAEARRWASALERALAAVAERHDAVLLPARAVAAGALDLTPEVEAALARVLQETAADTPAAPAGVRP